MTKLHKIAQIQISQHFLPAIFNADETHLSDGEANQLDAFLYPRFTACTFEVTDENPTIGHDEVTKTCADVVRLNVYKTPATLDLYAVEFTDTFGGGANYCWREAFTVRAKNMNQAITLAKKRRYHSPLPRHTRSDYGEQTRIDIKNACVCAFIEYLAPDEYNTARHGWIIN